MDATTADGRIVCLKRVRKESSERKIAVYLSSGELRADPHNHCVPILDYFDDELEAQTEIIVMPLLRRFYSPPFVTVEEAVDFFRQTLEVRFTIFA